jgi:chromosome segregation ATPase
MSQKSTFEIATELNQAVEENNRLQKIIDSYEANADAHASKGTAELLRDMSYTLSFAANEIDSLEESVTELEFQLDCADEEKKQLSIDLNHAIRRANYFENLEANVRSTLTTIAERQNRDNKKAKALEKENEHYKCRNKVLQEKVESLEAEIRDFLFEDKDLEPKDLSEELAQILESVLDTVTEDDCSEYETEEEFYKDCFDDKIDVQSRFVDTDNLPELSGCKKDDLDWNKLSPEFIAWRKKLLDE